MKKHLTPLFILIILGIIFYTIEVKNLQTNIGLKILGYLVFGISLLLSMNFFLRKENDKLQKNVSFFILLIHLFIFFGLFFIKKTAPKKRSAP